MIGTNTTHAMQSGVVFGYVGLVEGLLARFRKELGPDMKVIGTGGLVTVVSRVANVFDTINPDLTLLGLRMVYDLNRHL